MNSTWVSAVSDDEKLLAVDFEMTSKAHDWRNHVGEETKRLWKTFTPEQRRAIAIDAQEMADREEWD